MGPTCVCGLSVTENCRDCDRHIFLKNTAAFPYQDMAQEIIFRFKYGKKAFMAPGIARLMVENVSPNIFQVDYIVPVPIHKNRLKKRGFNQAQLLSKYIGKLVNKGHTKDLLVRVKDTKPLSNFTPKGRENTLKDAFSLKEKYCIADKKVLLIDDIFTTGATLNACAQILYKHGAAEVNCLTFSAVPSTKQA